MRTVPLSGKKAAGRVALVDNEDLQLVTGYPWWVIEDERKNGTSHGPYAYTTFRSGDGTVTTVYMHSLITSWPMTDHVNHDGLDNRRSNLRPATHAQNMRNQRPRHGTSSRYKGVTWHRKSQKWQAGITIDSRFTYLGTYTSEEEAALSYNAAALETFGEFACLNEVQTAT